MPESSHALDGQSETAAEEAVRHELNRFPVDMLTTQTALVARKVVATVTPIIGADVAALLRALYTVYKPEGVGVWLMAPHKSFGDLSALDLIQRGRVDEVAAEVERLTTGAFS